MPLTIVQFSNCLEVIPSSWLIKNNTFCYWPPSTYSRNEIETCIVTRSDPDVTKWIERAVLQIHGSASIKFIFVIL